MHKRKINRSLYPFIASTHRDDTNLYIFMHLSYIK